MTAQQYLRVVSLLPSATDVIAVAGGTHLLVGRSHECDWPSDVRKLPILTGAVNQFTSSKQMDDVVKASLKRGEGLYYLDQELLKELKPDVILTQDLCNVCSVDLQLVQQTIDLLSIKPKVVTLNPQKLSDVLEDISRVGKAVGREQESKTAVSALQQRVHRAQAAAQAASTGQDLIKVAFVEWLDPLFVGGHWTPEMIRMAGGVHPLNMPIGDGGAGPSIRIAHQALIDADCDWIIVCPCGFKIEDTKKEEDLLSSKAWWQNLRAVQDGKVAIVDGNQMFARPGPRLVDALEFLVGLLHNKPELIPKDFPWTYWDTHMQGRHADAVHTPAARHSSSMACTDDSAATVASDTRSLTEQDDVSSSIDKPDSKQDGQEAQQAQRAQQTAPCQQLNSLERKWRAAPYLGPEIEEAHASAIEAGQSTYVDPATGYQVMTEQALRRQSVCCANRCRHCPFGHYKVPPGRGDRINTITQPTVLKINRKDAQAGALIFSFYNNPGQCSGEATLSDPQELLSAKGEASIDVHGRAFVTSKDVAKLDNIKPNSSKSSKTFRSPDILGDEDTAQSVQVVVFDEKTGQLLGQKLTMHDVMDECLQSGQKLVAIPVNDYQHQRVMQGTDQLLGIAKQLCCNSQLVIDTQ